MSRRMLALGAAATVVAVSAVSIAVINDPDGPNSTIAPSIIAAPDGSILAAGLVQAQSCEDLAATMRQLSTEYGTGLYGYGGWERGFFPMMGGDDATDGGMAVTTEGRAMAGEATADMAESAPAPQAPGDADLAATGGVDGTNVQEVGVDEPDIVERVGDLVVTGTQGMLRVVSVADGVPTARGSLPIARWGGDLGLFAVGPDRVAVLAQGEGDGEGNGVRSATGERAMIRPGGWSTTTVTLIDLSDPDAPREVSSIELEGWMVDARAVDGELRVAVRSDGPQIDIYGMGEFGADLEMDWDNATDADYREYDRRYQEEYQQRMEAAMDLVQPSDWQPHVRITDASGASVVEPLVACDRIGFPTAFAGLGTLTLAAIDATGDELVLDDAEAVVTSGENLYATAERVVIATTRWDMCCDDVAPMDDVVVEEPPVDPFFDEDEGVAPLPAPETLPVDPDADVDEPADVPVEEPVEEPGAGSLQPTAEAEVLPMIEPGRGMIAPWGGGGGTTDLHVFDVDGGLVTHVASGAVNGSLLNQYAMSIHEGVLRVATTGFGDEGSESFVTTLRVEGTELVQLDQVGGLGVTETIRSVRFMGDVGYVVTFRQTDPLYVVDLADPADIRTVGELKIEGYSAYLHPLGDEMLLGVGQDADPETGWTRGLQVSTFDVSDMTAPTRIDVDVTPDSSSEVEWEPHALTVVAGRRVIVPVEIYGNVYRLGALVYDVADDGQLTNVGTMDSGDRWELRPRRTLDIDGVLLTVGEQGVIAWDRDTLQPLADVAFTAPAWMEEECCFEGDKPLPVEPMEDELLEEMARLEESGDANGTTDVDPATGSASSNGSAGSVGSAGSSGSADSDG